MLLAQANDTLLILLVAVLIALSILAKGALEKLNVPPLIGFLVLGFLLRLADEQWQLLGEGGWIIDFLAHLGVMALLFHVGLGSNLKSLLRQLPCAGRLWISDICISSFLGFSAAYWILGLSWITSVIVAIALTATSVGVPVKIWQDKNALQSANGERFIDVAELDDISGVLLMAMLFAMLPAFHGSGGENVTFSMVAKITLSFLISLLGYGLLCFIFAQYIEHRLANALQRFESPPDRMLVVVGTGFAIAALAALLGFSVAIGAFFAGLAFSRDPHSVRIEASFNPLYELFTPFFFINIGRGIDPSALSGAAGLGAVLLVAAVAGKFIAITTPALAFTSLPAAATLGVSMIPRAEIAMLVMHRGLAHGPWAVSEKVYAGMVFVCALTCIGAPLLLQNMLTRWPPSEGPYKNETEKKH
jgi:Kef-type K+ transport system membrane component KefB